jgi:hypothetical protein
MKKQVLAAADITTLVTLAIAASGRTVDKRGERLATAATAASATAAVVATAAVLLLLLLLLLR